MVEALAAISYDPQIRGFLIVLVAVLALCGSTYVLIATNTGARLGFLLAAAGLMGFMTVLAVVWTVYGIGPKGSDPSWEVEAVVSGDVGPTAQPELSRFPQGWRKLAEGDKQRAEAQATVDETLTGDDPAVASLGFSSASEYLPLEGFDKGGEKTGLFGIDAPRPLDVKHKPHYAVIQVQAVVTTTTTTAPPVQDTQAAGSGTASGSSGGNEAGADAQGTPSDNEEGGAANAANPNTSSGAGASQTTTTVAGETTPTTGTGVVTGQGSSGEGGSSGGSAQANQPGDQSNTANPSTPAPVAAPSEPVVDASKPVVTVLMVRDLGSRRLPPLLTAIFSGILFAILCIALHRRDKQIMKARAEAEDG